MSEIAEKKTCSCKGEPHTPKQHQCTCSSEKNETNSHACGCSSKQEKALDQSLIDDLLRRLANQDDYQKNLQCFKKHHANIRIIECSEDDMAEKEPFMAASYFDLFLMANGTSCARLTDSLDLAIGLVIALHEPE
ncbi:hypothetical protein [Agarivorans sp. Alg241-V36]|uniref:hypothetical protein n=1 Tax=Agarivorans sp. Alg241-V36 TaxID=2305992 RepID=UPI0013D40E57|nr:hypothetical protein [Agarivorans sp. Alg241-V36]